MKHVRFLAAVAIMACLPLFAHAADISGTWTASFDTQMGKMDYTYVFLAKAGVLSGTAMGMFGTTPITEGKVDKNTVTFVESITVQGMDIRIEYTGQIVSPNQIKFTRKVGDFGTEDLVATRKP
jgi:hypothetical protein